MSSKYCGMSVHLTLNIPQATVFEYKGTQFKLVPPQKPTDSDSLVCRMGHLDFADVYKLAYEFLSAVSYKYRVSASLGINVVSSVPKSVTIFEVQPFAIGHPTAKEQYTDEIGHIPLVKTEDQSILLRLYRQAFSVENPYAKFLFYWHALVYPGTSDQGAIDFINNNLNRCSPSYIDKIRKNPVFLNSTPQQISDMGEYFKNGIRHSIAHMTRSWGGYSGLDLDDLYEHEHLHLAGYVLEDLVRLRIERDYQLEQGDDPSIYKVLD